MAINCEITTFLLWTVSSTGRLYHGGDRMKLFQLVSAYSTTGQQNRRYLTQSLHNFWIFSLIMLNEKSAISMKSPRHVYQTQIWDCFKESSRRQWARPVSLLYTLNRFVSFFFFFFAKLIMSFTMNTKTLNNDCKIIVNSTHAQHQEVKSAKI